jgi:hypothetical protein
MKKLSKIWRALPIFSLALPVLFIAGVAYAATNDNTTVGVSDWWAMIERYALLAFGAILSGALTWGAAVLNKTFGLKLADSDRIAIQTAAMNAAGRILHSVEGDAAKVKIDVTSPVIAKEAARLQGILQEELDRLGYTPERVANMIAGKIGQLQQGTSTAVTGPTARR